MRKLIVTEFVSLDGVMEAPAAEPGYPHSGWVANSYSHELAAYKEAEQLDTDVLLLGRKTYESFVGAWPHREGALAGKINTMTKYVASTTLGSSEWQDTTVISSDLPAEVARLKEGDGRPILVAGSRSVVHRLLGAGLVDQINLQVMPVILGSGARLYPDTTEPIRLELLWSRSIANGVIVKCYRVSR